MKFLKKKYVLVGTGIGLVLCLALAIYIDAYSGYRFRTMQDPITSTEKVDLTGLKDLQASGGNIPRFPFLAWKLRHVKSDKMVVNAHGTSVTYIKGLPSTLLGYHTKKPSLRHYIRRLCITGTPTIRPDLIASEAEEAKKYGFGYKAIYIGSRFTTPDKNVDEIVDFFDTLPKDVWVHFHCVHGQGRTSMLMAMLDIMRNAPQVTLKEITRRQYLLGSVDLLDNEVWENGNYTQEQLDQRKEFIEKFYDFICQRKAGGIQQWSAWCEMQKENTLISLSSLKWRRACVSHTLSSLSISLFKNV